MGFQSAKLRAASPRQLAALGRLHPRLGAQAVRVGRWPFRRREWQVFCPDCNWRRDTGIPVMPPEMGLAENHLLQRAMEAHLVDALSKLTFAQVWFGGRG